MTAAPAPITPSGRRRADGRAARLRARLTSRLTDRLLGTALAVAACDPPAVPHASVPAKALCVGAVAAAWWAAPMVDARPVRPSGRRRALVARHRTTVLPAAAIVAAAATDPPFWLVVCVAALLGAYLLVTDAWTVGVTAPRERPRAATAAAVAAATAVVLLAAEAPIAGTSWARLPASLAVVATGACLVLALRVRHHPHHD
jgi:hypothetical protein